MTKINFPKQFAQIVVDNVVYAPDKNGQIEVENADHIPEITHLGGTVPTAVVVKAKAAPQVSADPVVVETPTENPVVNPTEEASDSINGKEVPTEDMTRPNMIEWLRKNGVAISTASSKGDAWTAIQSFLEQGDG